MALSLRKSKGAEATPAAFECVESFSTEIDHAPVTLKLGTRVTADHPAYSIAPNYFRPVNSADVDHRKLSESSEQPAPKAKPKPKLVKAKKDLTIDGIVIDGKFWMAGKTSVYQGQELPANHPIVSKNPNDFEKVKKA